MEAKTNLAVPPSFMQVRKPERIGVWLSQRLELSLHVESASGATGVFLTVSLAMVHPAYSALTE